MGLQKEKKLKDGIYLSVTLKDEAIILKSKSTKIRGKIYIVGDKVRNVDLGCIVLQVENVLSDAVYVDSVAHVLTSNIQARSGIVDMNLYWIFENKVLDKKIKEFSILVDEKCLIKN